MWMKKMEREAEMVKNKLSEAEVVILCAAVYNVQIKLTQKLVNIFIYFEYYCIFCTIDYMYTELRM